VSTRAGWGALVGAGGAWLAVSTGAAAGLVPLSLVDLAVLLGIGLVLPLALGGPARRWLLAGTCALVALCLPDGPAAALLVLPFAAAAALPTGAPLLAQVYAVVAAVALVQSRMGVEVLGIREPIVELTAVHYTYAGAAALVLAMEARAAAPAAWRATGGAAVVLTAAAPPVVAAGFLADAALPQVGGAVLMTLGVWATASLHLREAVAGDVTAARRALLAVSGLAVWAPMVLAVAWAAGRHWDVPALSIPAMARTHGLANALGFVVCGLVARRWRADLGALLDAARRAGVTYDHVGSTLVAGRARSLVVGHGEADFTAARDALRTWVPHAGIHARVVPAGPVEEGATVLVVLGPVAVPCRVVAVVDGPDRFAFAYGTLPGHPERGEECFLAEHLPDGAVRVTVRVQARPAAAARLAAPVVAVLQRAASGRYLRAVARHVSMERSPA
jgi:uncharacterized protein (UPF0548 family)